MGAPVPFHSGFSACSLPGSSGTPSELLAGPEAVAAGDPPLGRPLCACLNQ